MILLVAVLYLLLLHWVADFLCQSDYMAQNKSKSIGVLLLHTSVYTGVMFLGTIFNFCLTGPDLLWFALITFVAHTITDFFTSRLNAKLWNEKKVHWFFVSVGFDQLLHYTQLLLTYYFLTQ